MPAIRVVFYRDNDGSVPALDWLRRIPAKARDKCVARIELLAERGYELHRPLADTLRDGIHELRASHGGVHYRLLYFFHGSVAAVISHGLTKEDIVPPREIDRAIEFKGRFESDPDRHTHERENADGEEDH